MQNKVLVVAGKGAADFVAKSPELDVFVGEEPLSLEGLVGRFVPPPGWVAWAYTSTASLVGGFYMLKEDPERDVTCPPKFDGPVSTVTQRRITKAARANPESGSSSSPEVPMGVKENETALKHFGFNAWRQRTGTWKTEVDAVLRSGLDLYPVDFNECQCTDSKWIAWVARIF